jgi:uncharacterized OsmC-like protein/alpha/beta superfamily hydrolase
VLVHKVRATQPTPIPDALWRGEVQAGARKFKVFTLRPAYASTRFRPAYERVGTKSSFVSVGWNRNGQTSSMNTMNLRDKLSALKATKYFFKNSQGILLAAHMEWPAEQRPHTFAIFAHCFTCTKNLTAVRNISKALAGRGYAVLSFDFTGLGQSQGTFSESNFSGNVDDLISAARFLRDEFEAPTLLVGHSLGGPAVILAAASIKSVKAIATVGAPANADHVKGIFQRHLTRIEDEGVAEVNIGGNSFYIKQQFIDDLSRNSVKEILPALRKPILFLHSPEDDIVNIENAAELYRAAHHPKSFISLDAADHLLTKKDDSQYAGEVIAIWAHRYLEVPQLPSLETEHQTVALLGDQDSRYTTLIKAGKHFITADEPEDAGGDDFGPTPYQLLTSALAACTAMTLRMYANRKGFDVSEIKVHVNHNKRHRDDAEKSNQPDARLDHFQRFVEVEGVLSEEQYNRLLEIAGKCPVHKTLEGNVEITTERLTREPKLR